MRLTTLGASKQLPAQIYVNPQDLGEALARVLLERIAVAKRAGRRYLLGCPSGRSPMTTYQALGRLTAGSDANLAHLVLVMMDEYVVHTPTGYVNCPTHAHYSCHRFANKEIVAVINAGLPVSRRLSSANVWFPDPAHPEIYDETIRAAGGIDLFLLATGASDGHVAFNPPDDPVDTRTRIIPLPASTRTDNMVTFPDFTSLAEVPCWGVSVGLGTIATLSREVIFIAHGKDKQQAIRRLDACNDFDPQWPASIVYRCPHALVMLDEAATEG